LLLALKFVKEKEKGKKIKPKAEATKEEVRHIDSGLNVFRKCCRNLLPFLQRSPLMIDHHRWVD
jgi:hypothetical protein